MFRSNFTFMSGLFTRCHIPSISFVKTLAKKEPSFSAFSWSFDVRSSGKLSADINRFGVLLLTLALLFTYYQNIFFFFFYFSSNVFFLSYILVAFLVNYPSWFEYLRYRTRHTSGRLLCQETFSIVGVSFSFFLQEFSFQGVFQASASHNTMFDRNTGFSASKYLSWNSSHCFSTLSSQLFSVNISCQSISSIYWNLSYRTISWIWEVLYQSHIGRWCQVKQGHWHPGMLLYWYNQPRYWYQPFVSIKSSTDGLSEPVPSSVSLCADTGNSHEHIQYNFYHPHLNHCC